MAPDYIFYRDPMWLNCSVIDLDYNQIYSIKWFKDNDEMYRFITADETTPRTFYDTPGIVIDNVVLDEHIRSLSSPFFILYSNLIALCKHACCTLYTQTYYVIRVKSQILT
ncbi:hypothetical protein BLA29_009480 [Euroglyphus maynei]|uniref:Beat protein-like protein n=1 Tax=Euroglyphus maynei TaxID=6958 RepID=A0A1Y3B778_EURMA|nr:hypothetical protein BLA29_009480 [Euroglyphus maynei]